MISGFLCEVGEKCTLLGYYAVLSTITMLCYCWYHHRHHHHCHHDSTTLSNLKYAISDKNLLLLKHIPECRQYWIEGTEIYILANNGNKPTNERYLN